MERPLRLRGRRRAGRVGRRRRGDRALLRVVRRAAAASGRSIRPTTSSPWPGVDQWAESMPLPKGERFLVDNVREALGEPGSGTWTAAAAS